MEKNKTGIWFKLALLNLVIVALYGAMMRYKIAYNFPFLEQKNLLHAHSHFAFSGWIGHLLYSGLALMIRPFLPQAKEKKYNGLIIANLLCALGMLVAFTIQGYKVVSISFSTLSIVIAILFTWHFIKDTRHLPSNHRSRPWAVMGLILNILSSFGPFCLAYMMASKNIDHSVYLGSVYYYLHFQYNGWFFFGAMALMVDQLPENFPSLKRHFNIFAATVVPAFFLSILWAKLPLWLYILTATATLVQLLSWVMLVRLLWKILKRRNISNATRWIDTFFIAAALALTVKFILQAVSIIPSLSQLVFGFRPIIIAYLHLVLLGVYSLFFIGWVFARKLIRHSGTAKWAAFIFLTGVILNEALLGAQGVAAFAYLPVPYINEMLFGAAVLLLGSAVMLVVSQRNRAIAVKDQTVS